MKKYEDFFNGIKDLEKDEKLAAISKKYPSWKRWWIYFLNDDPDFIQRGCEKAIMMGEYEVAEFLVFRGADMATAMNEALKAKKFMGEKLRFVRKLKGLSLRDLAAQVGITRMAISNWETGATQPTKDNVVKLCDALDLEFDYFFKESVHEITSPKFRKEYLGINMMINDDEKLSAINKAGIKMEIEIIVEKYLSWFSKNPGRLFRAPSPAVVDAETEKEAFSIAESVAWQVRTDIGYGLAPVNNMISFAEKTGFVVHEMDLPDSVKAFHFTSGSIPFIFVNRSMSLLKKRFSIGHEIGHVVLDVKKGYYDDIEQGNGKPEIYEAEEALCHYFAAALIVPDKVLFRIFRKAPVTKESLIIIEREYGISCLGLLYRLLKLRIIDWKKLHSLERQLKNSNEEPGEEGCPVFAHESILFRNF